MSDALKLASHVVPVLTSLAETDLSLVEMAAVYRIAAEACSQANLMQEVALMMAKQRGK